MTKKNSPLYATLILLFLLLSQQSVAQITQTSMATIVYTGGSPDVFDLDGKEAEMTISWAENTVWVTFSNLQQAISQSTSLTIDGQAVTFPSNELPVIYNIVNSVSDRLAYSDINENVILNFTLFGAASFVRSQIHPDNPLTLTSGTTLERCHVDRGVLLLDSGGHYFLLDVGGAEYTFENTSNSVTGGGPVLGDVNLDCRVDLLDIDPFIDRVGNGIYQIEADTNQDGEVNLLDIDPFIAILSG